MNTKQSQCRRSGFTLNELLIVMGLIILILAIALPAFNVITGARSIESAENQISAFLGTTRAEAVALQEPRGVLFFVDPITDRVTLAQVYYPPSPGKPTIDLFPGREEMRLPAGVGIRAVPNGRTDIPPLNNMVNWPVFSLIMFDADGRLMLDTFTVPGTGTSPIVVRLNSVTSTAPDKMPLPQTNVRTNIGFILFDKRAHDQVPAASKQKWLTDNAVPYLVNRYDGTLLKGQ